jgi:hypothetical protein
MAAQVLNALVALVWGKIFPAPAQTHLIRGIAVPDEGKQQIV